MARRGRCTSEVLENCETSCGRLLQQGLKNPPALQLRQGFQFSGVCFATLFEKIRVSSCPAMLRVSMHVVWEGMVGPKIKTNLQRKKI